MNQISTDVAVVGAGSAGLTAFRAALTHTERVLLIESGPYGTTCARVGCMPSKLLIAAANAAHGVLRAREFGVEAGPIHVNAQAVMDRVRVERDRFVRFVVDSTEAVPQQQRLHGQARFLGPTRLQVGDVELAARAIVIATGSRPFIPPEFLAAGERLSTSDDVFEWTTLPESVAVIGTGTIALEIGQALHRLGVRVALFGRADHAGPLDDPDLRPLATRLFAKELDLRLNSRVVSCEQSASGVVLEVLDASGEVRRETFSRVLCATGRIPNLDRLDLAKAGLALDDKGTPLFDPSTMRCGESAIFLAGDASNALPLLHEAVDQGRLAGDNAGAWPLARPGMRHVPLAIAFCEPQLAMVGPSWNELKGRSFVVGRVTFENQGRSRVMAENYGALHVYAERGSGELLGAQMVGPRAEHLAHLLAWSLQQGLDIDSMLRMPFYHPVVEEGLRTALKDAREALRKPVPPIEHCDDCTPGV